MSEPGGNGPKKSVGRKVIPIGEGKSKRRRAARPDVRAGRPQSQDEPYEAGQPLSAEWNKVFDGVKKMTTEINEYYQDRLKLEEYEEFVYDLMDNVERFGVMLEAVDVPGTRLMSRETQIGKEIDIMKASFSLVDEDGLRDVARHVAEHPDIHAVIIFRQYIEHNDPKALPELVFIKSVEKTTNGEYIIMEEVGINEELIQAYEHVDMVPPITRERRFTPGSRPDGQDRLLFVGGTKPKGKKPFRDDQTISRVA